MASFREQSMNNGFHAGRQFRPILLLSFLALLPASVSGDSGLSPVPGTKGIQVTREVTFANETFDTVRAAAPGRPTNASEGRAIHFHRITRPAGAGPIGTTPATPPAPALALTAEVAAPVAPRAPMLDSSFPGLGNPTVGDVIPPDTMGAAGPNHLVSFLNSAIGVFDKSSGDLLLPSISLRSFWASLGTGPGQPAHSPFDPKILFDQYTGRFVAVTLGGESAGSSWIMLTVSSPDPTQAWSKWAIPSDSNNTLWADYPGFGLDGSNLYITANMFNNSDAYQYSKVWVVPKAQLLSGLNPITWTEFQNPIGSDSSMQPAHTFGTATTEYFIYELGSSSLGIARITNVAGTLEWKFLTSLAVPSFTMSVFLPGAPQLGSSNTIDTSDTRLLGAVYRSGSLWAVHTVQSPSVVKTEVAWYEIDPLPSTPILKSSGRITDPTRWYYYPSIGVNANGDVAIGMSGSSTIEYVGGFYSARRFKEPLGTMQPVEILKAGERPYYKTAQTLGIPGGDTVNRWGDYSATSVDPEGNLRFWTLQEFAATPDNTWRTWWGSFALAPLSAPSTPQALPATPVSGSVIILNWTDTSSNEDRFIIERKTGSGTYTVIATPATTDISAYSDNTLSERTTYTYRIKTRNSLGDSSYSNEETATTLLSTPTNLNAVVASSSVVNLTWNDVTLYDTGYIVERKTDTTGLFQTIASRPSNSISYSDNTVSAGFSYTYRVKAIDNVTPTQSAYSNEAEAMVPSTIVVTSGGGGGGCMSIAQAGASTVDASSVISVLILFLPAFVYGWKRFYRSGNA